MISFSPVLTKLCNTERERERAYFKTILWPCTKRMRERSEIWCALQGQINAGAGARLRVEACVAVKRNLFWSTYLLYQSKRAIYQKDQASPVLVPWSSLRYTSRHQWKPSRGPSGNTNISTLLPSLGQTLRASVISMDLPRRSCRLRAAAFDGLCLKGRSSLDQCGFVWK